MADYRLKMGETLDINVTIGAGSPDAGVTYELVGSSKDLATISSAGLITPAHPGMITVNATNASGTLLRTFLVEIVSSDQATFEISALAGGHTVVFSAALSNPEVQPQISSQGYDVTNTTTNTTTPGTNKNPNFPRSGGQG